MKEDTIKDLLTCGFEMAQISQLIKLEQNNIKLKDLYDNIEVYKNISSYSYRTFLNKICNSKYNTENKNLMFKYFIKGIDYLKILETFDKIEIIKFVCYSFYYFKENHCDVNLDIMLNEKYSLSLLKYIFEDILDGKDPTYYLDYDYSIKDITLIRLGIDDGFDFRDLVKSFNFLSSKDINYLKEIFNNNYDYKDVLQKTKDIKKTLAICNYREHGIDLLPYIRRDTDVSIINALGDKYLSEIDINPLKKFPIKSVQAIDVLLKINSLGYPLKNCKKLYLSTLNKIILALENNVDFEKINKALEFEYSDIQDVVLACYIYDKEEYIPEILKLDNKLFICSESIIELLKYNFNNKDKDFNLMRILFDKNGKFQLNEYYLNLIIKRKMPCSLFNFIIENGISQEQIEFVFHAYKNGYDINLFMDKRLSERQMESILNCLELGLTVKKEKEYNIKKINIVNHYNIYNDGNNYY